MDSFWGRYHASTAGDIASMFPPMRNARSVFLLVAAAASEATAADDLSMSSLTSTFWKCSFHLPVAFSSLPTAWILALERHVSMVDKRCSTVDPMALAAFA